MIDYGYQSFDSFLSDEAFISFCLMKELTQPYLHNTLSRAQAYRDFLNSCSHQSDSSIFSISSREGPQGTLTLYSPLEKPDLLYSSNYSKNGA